ncbi:MAG TPA: hypothetical protein VGS05_00030 [Candidatus Sulfotelmatobacter sp.]|nr:hypothetical protein [Candidatus Sulfotelmatobacter sp.]
MTGTSNTAVTWTVDSVSGGNSADGTIANTGLYTAPQQTGTHVITATSVVDATKSASATVTVSGSVSISPSTSTLLTGATQQFQATVDGKANSTVTWAVDGVNGGNSTSGTIGSAGLYTAPSQAGNHTISASAGTGAGNTASVQLNVFSFAISPDGAAISPGSTEQFTATIQGLTNTAVTWSVDGAAGGNSSVGTVSTSGLYTAPNAIGPHTVTAASVAYPSDTVNARITVINVAQSAVLTYHNDDARDGAYLEEVTLTPSNVNLSQFGKLISYPVDGQIYGQPLYLPQLNINGGTHDVVFVATQNNTVYAFDADATSGNGATFWQVNFGTPRNAYDSAGPWPVVGILSTPVIDATSNTIYVVSHSGSASPEYWLHALDVTTGKDKVSPVGITGSNGSDHLGSGCYQRMGLALDPVTNWIYVPFGSCPNGWMFAYDKITLQQKAVFEATPGAGGGGFWGSGAAPAIDDSTGDLYVMNGTDAGDQQWISAQSMTGYNDSFLRMSASDLSVLDYFAPDDNAYLATHDADLGSGGNVLLPGSSSFPHELLGGGKDGNVFVLNRDSMGGYNNTSNNVLQTVHTGTSEFDNIFSTPVYWNGMIYIHGNDDVLRAFSWNAGATGGQQLSSSPVATGNAYFGQHGATPSLSSNGNNNGILWDIDNSSYNSTDPTTSGAAVLHAYDAGNIANELYNSADSGSRDQAGQALKFTVPTIANGRVFVPTASELDIYGLLNP